MGSEFELPKTPIAVTKLDARLFSRNIFATTIDTVHDTSVCSMKMAGIIARSDSFSAFSCDASFVKTGYVLISQKSSVMVAMAILEGTHSGTV